MSNLVSTFKFKGSPTAYTVRDANTLLNLNATTTEEVTTFGTYNGNEVANNTVFTSDEGKFQEFTKVQETGETSFSEFGDFPDSTDTFYVKKITSGNSDFYLAVGGTNKCYTSTNGVTWTQGGNVTTNGTIKAGILYKNGVWVTGKSGRYSYSENNGTSWTTAPNTGDSGCVVFGIEGDYFYGTSPSGGSGKFSTSADGKTWSVIYSNDTEDMCYDGEKYIRFRGSGNADPYYIESTTTPMDYLSWQSFSMSGLSDYPVRLKLNNGRWYAMCREFVSGIGWSWVPYYSTNGTSWTKSQSVFSGDTRSKFMFIDDLVFVERSNNELWQSSDLGVTYTQLSNGNGASCVVDGELWEIYGGKIYSLNPEPHWEYNLTDLSGASTDQANAPTSSDAGYVGQLWITSGGAVYICTGVSGSTYTWAQITVS